MDREEGSRVVQIRDFNDGNMIIGNNGTINDSDVHQSVSGDVGGDLNAVVSSSLKDSVNRVATVPDGDLHRALDELVGLAGAMIRLLPPDDSKAAAAHLVSLTTQATSKTPEKHWYSVSADGLIEAAQKLGQVGLPIIELVQKVVRLLGG